MHNNPFDDYDTWVSGADKEDYMRARRAKPTVSSDRPSIPSDL